MVRRWSGDHVDGQATMALFRFLHILLEKQGPVAHQGERLLRKQEVVGSSPIRSTNSNRPFFDAWSVKGL